MNQLLEQVKQATLQKAKPQLVPAINKLVDAGMQIMYSEQTSKMFMEEVKGGVTPQAVGAAVAKLMGVLQNQAKGTIPPEILVPAATILMAEGLGFLEEAGLVKADANLIAACTKEMGSSVLQLMGVTPEKLQGMMAKQQPAQQPTGIAQGGAQ